jgi:hypothetical protein
MAQYYVLIGVFAGNYVSDARTDKRRPQASAKGIGSRVDMKNLQGAMPEDSHVVFQVLPLSTAKARYTLMV